MGKLILAIVLMLVNASSVALAQETIEIGLPADRPIFTYRLTPSLHDRGSHSCEIHLDRICVYDSRNGMTLSGCRTWNFSGAAASIAQAVASSYVSRGGYRVFESVNPVHQRTIEVNFLVRTHEGTTSSRHYYLVRHLASLDTVWLNTAANAQDLMDFVEESCGGAESELGSSRLR